jgi:predicted ATPase/DNA-binding winged helix-turn-helix (wHTH) protein
LLLEGGAPVRLGSRAFEILTMLVERPGEVVEKNELITRVWPNTFIDENTLRVHVSGLRRALGDGQPGRRYVASVPGRGYRFVAPVDLSDPEGLPIRPPVPPPSHNLPISKSRIVGRTGAIEAVRNQLLRQRLVTIVGAGGIGKTTVALGVAEALLPTYPDGVRFIDLAPVEEPQFVASAVGIALGIAVQRENAITLLVEFLRDKRTLIVLDSCEHIVEVAASLVEQLLAGASGVHILATSREPLRAEGERVHRLLPLEVPADHLGLTAVEALAYPAVQLFVERAAAILDAYELTDADAPAVSDICRKLGGIALAIELAAARTDAFGIHQLAVLLDDRFRILKHRKRTAQPRHRSLAATLDWSYEFLPESERVVLRRLSTFAGPFTLGSAVAVAGDDDIDVIEAVANLVTKSLLSADIGGTAVQYRLPDTTRAYALQKLIESGRFQDYARRHALHHLDRFQQAENELLTRKMADWNDDYGRRVDDVRSALGWAMSPAGDVGIGIALTAASVPLWLDLSLLQECRERIEHALASLSAQPSRSERDELKLYLGLGLVWPHASRVLTLNDDFWTKALAIGERLGDLGAQGRILFQQSAHYLYAGKSRQGLAIARQCRDLADKADDRVLRLMGYGLTADALHRMGDHTEALDYVGPLFKEIGGPEDRAVVGQRYAARATLSLVLWSLGFRDQAVDHMEIAFADAKKTNNAMAMSGCLVKTVCPTLINAGRLADAEDSANMLLDLTAKSGLAYRHAMGRCFKGALLVTRGDFAGLDLLQDGLGWMREARFVQGYPESLGALALGLAAAERFAQARSAIDEALECADVHEERWCIPELLRVKGEILRLEGPVNAAAAEVQFHEALALASQQRALSWELRAATSMARLWREKGRATEAKTLLSSVYDRFTEGFDTLDLRTARTLIDELK